MPDGQPRERESVRQHRHTTSSCHAASSNETRPPGSQFHESSSHVQYSSSSQTRFLFFRSSDVNEIAVLTLVNFDAEKKMAEPINWWKFFGSP